MKKLTLLLLIILATNICYAQKKYPPNVTKILKEIEENKDSSFSEMDTNRMYIVLFDTLNYLSIECATFRHNEIYFTFDLVKDREIELKDIFKKKYLDKNGCYVLYDKKEKNRYIACGLFINSSGITAEKRDGNILLDWETVKTQLKPDCRLKEMK